MNKRISLFLVPLLFLVCLFSANFAKAASPTQSLQVSIDEILEYLKKPEYTDPTTRPPLQKEVEKIIYKIFDFDEFSKRAVGTHWKKFSDTQKEATSTAFAALLSATYLGQIKGYNGEKFDYVGEMLSKNGKRAEVRTSLQLSNKTSVPVAYRMIENGGVWRVYDVVIEQVSLVKNYRSQFGALLKDESPEELIARIKERTQHLEAEQDKQ